MKLVKLTDDVVRLTFDSLYEQAISMFRIQEFYESAIPELKNNITNFEKAMDIQAAADGGFNYTNEIVGHNIPGTQVRKFYNLFNSSEHPLLEKEKAIKEILMPWIGGRKRWYLIAAYGDGNSFAHEVAHALFYLDKQYQKRALKLLAELPVKYRESVEKTLLEDYSYAQRVVADETHAYLSTGSMHEIIDFFGDNKIPWNKIAKLQMNFLRAVQEKGIEL